MPELPEVETIKRGLERSIVGEVVKDIQMLRPRQLTNASPSQLKTLLGGGTIVGLTRRGKYLILFFGCGYVLVIHLRMTGQLILYPRTQKPDAYTRMILVFRSGGQLHLRDVRAFAKIALVGEDQLQTFEPLAKLGPEPLAPTFTLHALRHSLSKRKAAIKSVLLDQRVVCGLGNIYSDEALFMAGINPVSAANALSDKKVRILYSSIKKVLINAIDHGGTSFSDYVNAYGLRGTNQDHLLVYGRKGCPCLRCNTTLQGLRVGGRSSVYCPSCQPVQG